jgi:hypothetical protein
MHVAAIVSALLVLGGFLVQAGTAKSDASKPDTTEMVKAVTLTAAKLQSTVKSPADYKLIKMELTWINGKYTWRATYKPINLLPKDPSKEAIGAGGEVFISVDLKTEQTEIGQGE